MRPSDKEIKAALLKARAKIESDEDEFLCNALSHDDAGNYIRSFITKAINPEDTLNAWVYRNIGCWARRSEMRVYRLRWIDYMLEGL